MQRRERIACAWQLVTTLTQGPGFRQRSGLKSFRHARCTIGSWLDPVQPQHVSYNLRLSTSPGAGRMLRGPAGKQLKHVSIDLFVHAVIFDQRMIDVPQHEQRAHGNQGTGYLCNLRECPLLTGGSGLSSVRRNTVQVHVPGRGNGSAGRIEPGDPALAGIGPQQRGGHPDHRGLAGAVDVAAKPASAAAGQATYRCATIATVEGGAVRTISHRELRNNSAEVLRAVSAGETIEVTNHGEVAAVLVPPSLTPYKRLVAAGKVREPRKDRPVNLRSIRRTTAPVPSTEIIADVRGDR